MDSSSRTPSRLHVSIREFLLELISVIFGIVLCFGLVIFLILTSPVLIIRVLVICMAKLVRPDLGNILNGQSVMYAVDYFSKTPSRGYLLVTAIIKGEVTTEEIKTRVMETWMNSQPGNGQLIYKKFQQYPTRWMGFAFWKDEMDTLRVDKHVHKLYGKETPVTDEQLTEAVEKLMNTRLPENQSPWEFHMIENYIYPHSQANSKHSVMIVKYHHTIADGFGMMTSVAAIFDKHSKSTGSKFPLPSSLPRRSVFQNCVHFLKRIKMTLTETSQLTTHMFQKSCWKISDEKKAWYQFHVRADPIPIQVIKDIKNNFGVSFTSVLLSALSAAMNKFAKEFKTDSGVNDTEICLSMVPIPNRMESELLTNKVAGVVLALSCQKFESPVDRLREINEKLENVQVSFFPYLSMLLTEFLGRHFYPICRLFFQNKWIPVGLSNFPGYPWKLEIDGQPLLEMSFAAGGLAGDTGVAVTVLGYGEKLRIELSTEEGLMTRQKTKAFLRCMTHEIQLLHSMIT